jgi:hypothetical protein
LIRASESVPLILRSDCGKLNMKRVLAYIAVACAIWMLIGVAICLGYFCLIVLISQGAFPWNSTPLLYFFAGVALQLAVAVGLFLLWKRLR